ncbi:MAG: hypothetical protein CMJ20_02525 [Phycisphaeraceae bacterium]|nr:hypothetical protein [Phycisphaeraceae bacterium]|tara:strand:- start:1032 stop:1994 length:963 start_codon:yes stop_codon:yes gene_type:complete
MVQHKQLSAGELHDPKGKSPTFLDVDDNTAEAYKIYEDGGDDDYFVINTTDGGESISFGNSDTNPKLLHPGSGAVGLGATSPASPNGNAKVLEIEGASVGIVLHSTNGGGTPYEIQNNSETFRILYNTTNRLTIENDGKIGIGTTAPDKALEINSSDGNTLRITHNDANGSAANYADLSISSAGYVAIKNSAAKGQGGIITKTVVQSDSTAGAKTYSAAELLSGYIIRDPAGGDRSDVTPTAAQLVAVVPSAAVNDSFRFIIKNLADADETITLTGGTNVTITGTATIAQNNTKEWLCVLTNVGSGTEAATIYSLGTWTH